MQFSTRRDSFFSPEVVAEGTELFNQQFWCLGADIRLRDPQGVNLLQARGFDKHRDQHDSSYYTTELSATDSLGLWAYGLLYFVQHEASLLISRTRFVPKILNTRQLFDVPADPLTLKPTNRLSRSEALYLCAATFNWLADYEETIQKIHPLHRQQVLSQRKNQRLSRYFTAQEMIETWRKLALGAIHQT